MINFKQGLKAVSIFSGAAAYCITLSNGEGVAKDSQEFANRQIDLVMESSRLHDRKEGLIAADRCLSILQNPKMKSKAVTIHVWGSNRVCSKSESANMECSYYGESTGSPEFAAFELDLQALLIKHRDRLMKATDKYVQ